MFHVVWILFSAVELGVIWLWATRTFPALARRRRTLAAAFVSLIVAQTCTRWVVVHWHVGSVLEMVFVVTMMTLGIASLPIGVLQLASWASASVARRALRQPTAASPSALPGPVLAGLTRRQVVEAAGGLSFLGATGSMLGWGIVRGRHAFEIDEVAVRIAGLPRALDGYVIAQVSDLHCGTYVGERLLDEGLDRVRKVKPDLLVVTGDLVDFDPVFCPMVASRIMRVAPRDGVFGCIGNHDDYTGVDRLLAILRPAGIRMLVNDGCVVRPRDGGGFALLGVDDRWSTQYGRSGPDLDRAASRVPPAGPRILLSHQPVTVDRWAGRVALQLSGHTHGGQINPGFRPADLLMRYVAGRYEVGSTTLYVNRGFGTVGPPSRVGAPPEVTRIVLVAA
ncbi:MAG: metallophosphoesterase [Polyangiaceae bacterium]